MISKPIILGEKVRAPFGSEEEHVTQPLMTKKQKRKKKVASCSPLKVTPLMTSPSISLPSAVPWKSVL